MIQTWQKQVDNQTVICCRSVCEQQCWDGDLDKILSRIIYLLLVKAITHPSTRSKLYETSSSLYHAHSNQCPYGRDGKDVVVEIKLSSDVEHWELPHAVKGRTCATSTYSLKHHSSFTFCLSGSRQLLCSTCHAWPPGPLTPESSAGRNTADGRWLDWMIGSVP